MTFWLNIFIDFSVNNFLGRPVVVSKVSVRPRQFIFLNSGQDSQKSNVGGRNKNKNKMVSNGNFYFFSGLDRHGMSVGKKIKIKVDPWVQDEKDWFFSLFCIIFHNFMTVGLE